MCKDFWNLLIIRSNYMTTVTGKASIPSTVNADQASTFRLRRWSLKGLPAIFLFVLLVGSMGTLWADTATPATAGSDDFGQYLAAHEADLDPFFSAHGGEFFRDALPVLLQLLGWVSLATILAGWVIDIAMSRGYAALFSPAFATLTRSLMYATGALVLSLVYTALIALIVVFCVHLPHGMMIVGIAMIILVLVALAAQIVWILYIYRTNVPISALFYIALLLVHG